MLLSTPKKLCKENVLSLFNQEIYVVILIPNKIPTYTPPQNSNMAQGFLRQPKRHRAVINWLAPPDD